MNPNIFKIQEYPAGEVAAWKNPRHERPVFSDLQQRLARLEPLSAEPPPSSDAEQLIKRFSDRYPFESFCRVQATASVTSQAKGSAKESTDSTAPLPRKLDLPRFFAEEQSPKPTDIGNATHTVLQHFDFSSGDIEGQTASLVRRKLLSGNLANLVDREAIGWLLQSDVGKLIRANHANLMRELPFALADESAGERTCFRRHGSDYDPGPH